jgi:hypothetical protein
MISLHHSERVHPANSGRVSTSSIPVASASVEKRSSGRRGCRIASEAAESACHAALRDVDTLDVPEPRICAVAWT